MAFADAGIFFRIKADSSQANKEIAAFTAKIFGLGKDTEAALAKLPLAAGAAVAAIAGIGGAAVVATKQLFDLASAAAEYGSTIHDVADKTGISTDAIQALKFAADESGSSLEEITGAVSKFSVLLGNAKNNNEKAVATLDQYGITAKTTDEALAQAIKTIASMTDHDQQAAAAKALFKDRTAAILPVIKSFDGDLPGLIGHLRDLGLIMSREATNAADEFGDQMDTLTKQLGYVKIAIGAELMPVFLDFAKQFSDWLKDNPGEVKAWGEAIGNFMRRVVLGFEEAHASLQLLVADSDFLAGKIDWDKFMEARRQYDSEKIRIGLALENGPGNRGGVNDQPDEFQQRFDPRSQFTPKEDPEAAKKRQEEAEKAKREAEQRQKERLASLARYYQTLLQNEKENQDALADIREESFKKGEITAQQYLQMSKQGVLAYYAFVEDQINKNFKIEKDQAKNSTDVKTAELQRDHAIIAAKREGQLELENVVTKIEDDQKKRAEDRQKSEEEEIKIIESLLNTWQEYGRIVEDVLDRVTTSMEKWANLNKETADLFRENVLANRELQDAQSDGQRALLERLIKNPQITGTGRKAAIKELQALEEQEARRRYQRQQEDLNAEENAAKERIKGKENEEEQKRLIEELFRKKRLVSEQEFQNELKEIQGGVKGGGIFDSWKDSWGDFFNTVSLQVGDLGSALGSFAQDLEGAFDGMANAMGRVVENWVLTGETGPAVMKKILASALATIAAEAAVRAIYATALGFFYLAIQDYASATNAFIAAAFFGAVAATTAIAGRAIAGDSFKKQSGSANSRSSGSSRGSNIDQNPTPYSREQQNTYDSGQRGIFGQFKDQYVSALTDAINQNTAATQQLHNKIETARPGDVLVRGMNEKPGAVGNQLISDVKRDSSIGTRLGKHSGMS